MPTMTRWSLPWPAGIAARSSGRSASSITPSSGSSRSQSPNPSPSSSPVDPHSASGKSLKEDIKLLHLYVSLACFSSFAFPSLVFAVVEPRSRSSIMWKIQRSRRFHLKGESFMWRRLSEKQIIAWNWPTLSRTQTMNVIFQFVDSLDMVSPYLPLLFSGNTVRFCPVALCPISHLPSDHKCQKR